MDSQLHNHHRHHHHHHHQQQHGADQHSHCSDAKPQHVNVMDSYFGQ
jgi:hypothetical protein